MIERGKKFNSISKKWAFFECRKHTYRFQFSALANLPLLLLYYFHMLERSVTKVSKRYVTKKLEIGIIESENKEETVPFSLEGRKTRFAPHLRANTIGSVEWVNQRRDEIAPPPNVRLIESWIEEEWSGEQEYLTKLWVSAVSSFPSFFPIFLRFLLTVRPLFIADRAESLESAGRQPRLMSCDECPRWTRSPLSPSPSFSLPVSSLHGRLSLSLSLSPFRPLSPEIPPLSLEFSESLRLAFLSSVFIFIFPFRFLFFTITDLHEFDKCTELLRFVDRSFFVIFHSESCSSLLIRVSSSLSFFR